MLIVVIEISKTHMNNLLIIFLNSCRLFIFAISDTTTITETWTLSLFTQNSDVLKKAKYELDIHVGKDKSDMKNLVHLQAILKTSCIMLLHCHSRMNPCKTTLGGYHISAGTRLIVDVSKFHQDSRVGWIKPSSQPEISSRKNVSKIHQDYYVDTY